MQRRIRIHILLISLVSLPGCSNLKTEMVHCFDMPGSSRECSIVAAFKDMTSCKQYSLIFRSHISYSELDRTGQTLIQLGDSGSISDRANSETICQERKFFGR